MQQSLIDLWGRVPMTMKHILYAIIVFVIFWLIATIVTSIFRKIIGLLNIITLGLFEACLQQ